MINKHKSKYVTFFALHAPLLVLAVAVAGVSAVATNVAVKNSDSQVLGSKNQGGKDKASPKAVKIREAKTVKAQEHKKIMTNVVDKLDKVAESEETSGNTETSEDITEVVTATEETASETVEAVDELESESPFKKFILGPNYKNLGQLRSSLAHTENSLRKLDKTKGTLSPEAAAQLEASRVALELEKTKIYNVVAEYEGQFSLLGWMVRLLNGYTPLPDPTPSPTPTGTPTASPDVTPTATPVGTPAATPTSTPAPTATPEVTPTPSPAAQV